MSLVGYIGYLALILPAVIAETRQQIGTPDPTGSGIVCGNITCVWCCFEGYECAMAQIECATEAEDDEVEDTIFVVVGTLFGAWVILIIIRKLWVYYKNLKKHKKLTEMNA